VLDSARVWVNGDEPADGGATVLDDGDEVAVLPPVSGG
jgi:molybdopterin converting factor small subunit